MLPLAVMVPLIWMLRTAIKLSVVLALQLTASLTKISPLPDTLPLVLTSVTLLFAS